MLMRRGGPRSRGIRWVLPAVLCVVATFAGCETDSFFDPSILGRWEHTPVVLPILDQLDVIDEPSTEVPGLSEVQTGDLIPLVQEYVVGPGDTLTVSIFELIEPGQETVQTRRVDELGKIRLPVVGAVDAAGRTASELERDLVQVLEAKDILKDATVSVIVTENRQNTYSIIGEPRLSGTEIGTYTIPKTDFRLLDALALARGVSGSIKKIFVIRQIPMAAQQQEVIPTTLPEPQEEQPAQPPSEPSRLIEDLLKSLEEEPDGVQAPGEGGEQEQAEPQGAEPPMVLGQGLEEAPGRAAQWVNVGGQWVRVEQPAAAPAAPPSGEEAQAPLITQRIIRIPYDKLLDGDMRYNIVVRPGDIIRVPPPTLGNVYIGGAISRPGTYALPGDRDLTLKQLIFAAGNVSQLAIPERVDLIRRVGNDQEAIVRLNLRAIFEGTQPDFYLKTNDTINIGTSLVATPLAVIRNGLRMSYGFGFVLDRNFSTDVFGPIQTRNVD